MSNLQKFYFTFGMSEEYPFKGGWVEIYARDINSAAKIFKEYYPNPDDHTLLNCSDYYTEKAFESKEFEKTGNFGAFCHQVIKPLNNCDTKKTVFSFSTDKEKNKVTINISKPDLRNFANECKKVYQANEKLIKIAEKYGIDLKIDIKF